MAGGSGATNIAKWDGSSWTALGSGMNGVVDALAVSAATCMRAAIFGTAGGKVSPYIARANLLTLPTVPTATLVFSSPNIIFEVAGPIPPDSLFSPRRIWFHRWSGPRILPAPIIVDGQNTVTNLISSPQKFYRLVQ